MKKLKQFINWLREGAARVKSSVEKIDIDKAIDFANKVKAFVNSEIVETIVTISPTDIDNQIRRELDQIMEGIIDTLQLAKRCNDMKEYPDKLQCFIQALKEFSPAARRGFYLQIAAWFLKRRFEKEGIKIKQGQAMAGVQLRYDELFPES